MISLAGIQLSFLPSEDVTKGSADLLGVPQVMRRAQTPGWTLGWAVQPRLSGQSAPGESALACEHLWDKLALGAKARICF